jgi:hypothetical protein
MDGANLKEISIILKIIVIIMIDISIKKSRVVIMMKTMIKRMGTCTTFGEVHM